MAKEFQNNYKSKISDAEYRQSLRRFLIVGGCAAGSVGSILLGLNTLLSEPSHDISNTPPELEDPPQSENTENDNLEVPNGYEVYLEKKGYAIYRRKTSSWEKQDFYTYAMVVDLNRVNVDVVTGTRHEDGPSVYTGADNTSFERLPLRRYTETEGSCAVNGVPYFDVNDFEGGKVPLTYPVSVDDEMLNKGYRPIVDNKQEGGEISKEHALMLILSVGRAEIKPFDLDYLNRTIQEFSSPVDMIILEDKDAPGRENRKNVNRTIVGTLDSQHLIFMINERMEAKEAHKEIEKWNVTSYGKVGGGNDSQLYCEEDGYISAVKEEGGIRNIPQVFLITPK